jgi:hypothetical protein
MGKPDHASTKKWIFEGEEFLQMAFIIGIAHGKGMLKEELKIRWITFLLCKLMGEKRHPNPTFFMRISLSRGNNVSFLLETFLIQQLLTLP